MKSALIFLVLIVIAACLDKINGDDEIVDCSYDRSVCSDEECCVYVDDDNNICRRLSREDEGCSGDFPDYVDRGLYEICQCMKGLTCVWNEDYTDDSDTEPPGFCKPDNYGLTTNLPENLHGMQNETKPILPSDEEEKEKYLDLEKNIKKENLEVKSAEIENLQFEKPGKEKQPNKKCRYGRKPSVFPSRIWRA